MTKQNRRLSRTILLALATMASTVVPNSASSQPAPVIPELALEATVVNNHREVITAKVWVDGKLVILGELRDGERRTFTLPLEVVNGAKFYLVSDSRTGSRITSDALTGSRERHTNFVVGRTARQTYVRYDRLTP
jgi:hypothetical protein